MPDSSGAGDKKSLWRSEGTGITVLDEGAGDSGAAGETKGSFFSTGNAIRLPPRTPPSQDKKQEAIDPANKRHPAMMVGRR